VVLFGRFAGKFHLVVYLTKSFNYDKFKKKFDQEAILRNLSARTRKSYWWHIEDYRKFIDRDPQTTGVHELRRYFQSMLTDGNHKPGSVKMGYYALKFLFVHIYHKTWAKEYLPTPKVAKTLPLVLSTQEVYDVFQAIDNIKHRTIMMFIYATGVRVSECINIKITDIDSKRMKVNIQEGKGLKQRQVPLSPVLLQVLRKYFLHYRPQYYLFESANRKGSHLSASAVREICKQARHRTTHINKHYTPHTFRHCFATHHLEQGTNLLLIQRLMGHANLQNTLKYPHVQNLSFDKLINPLDQLAGVQEL
jgi:integrase/recombinase XerD